MVDEETFVREVEEMERMLYRVSRSLLSSREECGDAVQEALMKAWTKRSSVQAERFRPWLMRIVINECHNIGRRKKRVTPVAEVMIPGTAYPEPDAPDEKLRIALANVPEKLRMPLILHHLEGFSVAEAARILHVPEGTVKSRLHHARIRLRKEWEEINDED